jgi:hypothetical protein
MPALATKATAAQVEESPQPAIKARAPEALSTPIQIPEGGGREAHRRPRFITGAITGIATGIVLGVIAAVLITMASPDARSAVIVGAGQPAAPPSQDGTYVARIIGQDINPTLLYADDDVAALFVPSPDEPKPAPVVAPSVDRDLQDNAALIFGVLAGLTLASWSLIMHGLTSHPAVASAAVE